MVGDPEQEDFGRGVGPDDTDDGGRIIDRDEEQFCRFLSEIQRVSAIKREPDITAEVTFDVLGKMPSEGRLMSPELIIYFLSLQSRPQANLRTAFQSWLPSQSHRHD